MRDFLTLFIKKSLKTLFMSVRSRNHTLIGQHVPIYWYSLCIEVPPWGYHIFQKFYTLCRFTDGTAGYVEEVTPFSKINVVCPNPTTVTKELFYNPIEKFMFENIWIVDKHSYENCAVNTSRPGNKLLLRCNSPLSLRYYTIVFQMYSATLHGLAFKPGKTYYFICEYE